MGNSVALFLMQRSEMLGYKRCKVWEKYNAMMDFNPCKSLYTGMKRSERMSGNARERMLT